MPTPPITYTSLTQYFRTSATSRTSGGSGGFTVNQISSALTGLLGGSVNFGISPLQQSVGANLAAAQQTAATASASAKKFDTASAKLTSLGKIAGTLAPSSGGGPNGDAANLAP